jgi:hypothetical protein
MMFRIRIQILSSHQWKESTAFYIHFYIGSGDKYNKRVSSNWVLHQAISTHDGLAFPDGPRNGLRQLVLLFTAIHVFSSQGRVQG